MAELPGHVKIGTFADHNLAALVRSRLETAGIDVVAPFEHTSALRIPFVSGRLKLYVREEDEATAWAVLNDPEYAVDDDAEDMDDEEEDVGEDEYACPHCGSRSLRLLPAPLWPIFLSIVLPRYSLDRIPSRWHCHDCDQLWEE